jgi:CRP/FNR family cyclic AMP-dependent transcriptional regulator
MDVTLLSPREARLLRELPLFDGLEEEALAEIAARMRRRRFRRGEVVYHTEDLPGSVYVVLEGLLKLQLQSPSGKRLTMSWIRPGSFFGTISLLDGQERLADAVAIEPSELLVLNRDSFRELLRAYPRQAEALLEITAARWRNTLRRLAEQAFLDVPGRLAKTLLDWRPAGDSEAVRIRQSELAAMVGTSRESVGRWLKTFAEAGYIESKRGRILVLKPEELRRHVRW